ncbi:unnamed protein product [Mycena citricolor]|uniref:Transposase n=1 Tax=Mycena citricolor TaxID=2018698 RepID=A0AAD2K9G2_9AGAR|nr:unnamed protein product [Mycena citricolor]
MPPPVGAKHFSRQEKELALRSRQEGMLTVAQILRLFQMSRSTFRRIERNWRLYHDVVPPYRPHSHIGRPRLLNYNDLTFILALVAQNPAWFLTELQGLLKHNRVVSVHFTTIHRALERAGVSRKKLKVIACERNEDVRNDYNDKTPARRYGRSRRNRRAVQAQRFVRGIRLSAVGLLTARGMEAAKVVEGSFHRVDYLDFLQNHVVSVHSVSFTGSCLGRCL